MSAFLLDVRSSSVVPKDVLDADLSCTKFHVTIGVEVDRGMQQFHVAVSWKGIERPTSVVRKNRYGS